MFSQMSVDFPYQMIAKRRGCGEKWMKMIILNILYQNSQIKRRSCFGNRLGLKRSLNLQFATEILTQKCILRYCKTAFFKELNQCLENQRRHSFSSMTMHPLIRQFSLKFTCISVRLVSFLRQRKALTLT